jgi:leukotriene-A4 hydrolase
MRSRRLALVLASFFFLLAARHRAVHHPVGLPQPPVDIWTTSNASAVATKHLALDLTVDFQTRQLRGSATHTIENLTGATTFVLDARNLEISSVTLDGTTPALWSLSQTDVGGALTIGIQPGTRTVTIHYATSPGAAGLHWNTAMQSYGRKEPYLYSVSEAVFARTWIPVQDSPSRRMTWEATLRVPPQVLALMSAENNPTTTNGTGVYTFRMTKTVPAYLIALAVGRLEFRSLDGRSGVYAEPELLDDAVWELQSVPAMMSAAEEIAGPYPFLRYDILLMPPTYILGGMEHPLLNFIHPFAVVTGNRPAPPEPQLLIAHELAHSWAGDLVTLATWDDVWLNEGFASYLALRIMEAVAGAERVELSYFLDRRSYARFAANTLNPERTIMHRRVEGPDGAFDSTAYTKGELFLRTLEDLLGRPTFDRFLRRWFERYAWRWVDDVAFVTTLSEFVPSGTELRVQEWIYGTRLPSNVTAATSSAIYTRAEQRATAFANGTPVAELSPSTWTAVDIEQFFEIAPATAVQERVAELDAALHFSGMPSPPLRWLFAAIRANYMPAMDAVERWLQRGGPNGLIVNFYFVLLETNPSYAREAFARYRERYDRDVQDSVESILKDAGALREAA